ncbi:uncharacterized protein LOC135104855 isoform X2 [Scylla paramamosain]|uniref:uncharacterized protein LOC135104855 isoform X2 n=1 Tax=Scylla paramamosain TaxID=85552 RepID=UPI003083294B
MTVEAKQRRRVRGFGASGVMFMTGKILADPCPCCILPRPSDLHTALTLPCLSSVTQATVRGGRPARDQWTSPWPGNFPDDLNLTENIWEKTKSRLQNYVSSVLKLKDAIQQLWDSMPQT